MSAMNNGLTGIKAASTHVDVISNNIANASTTGFKKGDIEFGDLVDANAGKTTPGSGVRTQVVTQSFLQGDADMTGNALDLRINGEGFFAVKDSSGNISYTRAGHFIHDKDGYIVLEGTDQQLVDKSGNPLKLSGTGPWTDISVDSSGNITAKDSTGTATTPIQIELTNFPNVNGLKRIGDTQWAETTASGTKVTGAPGANGLGELTSGELESSNVDLTTELVNLITAQRDFNANSKSITAGKEMIQTVINI